MSAGPRGPTAGPLQEIERRLDSLLENEGLSVTGQGLLEHVREFARELATGRAARLWRLVGFAQEIQRATLPGDAHECARHIETEARAALLEIAMSNQTVGINDVAARDGPA